MFNVIISYMGKENNVGKKHTSNMTVIKYTDVNNENNLIVTRKCI